MKCKICQKDSIFISGCCNSCLKEIVKVREGILGVTEPYTSPLKLVNDIAYRIENENE
jgi:hypothetical protein